MMVGEAAELFVALPPVHLFEQHHFLAAEGQPVPLVPLRRYLTRALGRTSDRLYRASQRGRNDFKGLYGSSMGQEDFALPDILFMLV